MMAVAQKRDGVHVAAVLVPGDANDHQFVVRLQALGVSVTRVVVRRRSYLTEYRNLRALMARLEPRIVHFHGYRADLIGGAAARALHIPRVSTVHGFVGGSLRNRVYERMQLMALRHMDAVLAVSRPLADRLAKAGVPANKIHFVPNGFAPVAPTATRAVARQQLSLNGGTPVIGWVGRLSREKGPDVMLDAIAACETSWRLSMIGDGPERESLRQRAATLGIADRVLWHGPVSNAGALFSAFDAFVLSSRTEGTPIALFEAMHSNVPIVTTTVGGVPDVVSSDEAILVPSEQPTMIARALDAILSDPAAAKQRSARASQRLLRDFGPEKWLADVERIYRAIESSVVVRGEGGAASKS
jgi:glycosyltransferase involved in cell wall biosynthesis